MRLKPFEQSSRASTSAIVIEGLFAGYGEQTVLEDVSCRLPERRTSVVLGPGGSGKTTLLKVLTASADDGLWWRGRVEAPAGTPRVLRQKPQPQPACLADLLADPAMAGPAGLEGWLRTFWSCAPGAAETLIAVLDTPFGTLPGQLRRLAAFTYACARPAPYYLLDEPEVALDDELQDALVAKLEELRGFQTLVVVTHNLRFARRVGDFALMLLDGKLIEAAASAEFFEAPRHPRAEHYVRLGG